jgi:hypothetical protein
VDQLRGTVSEAYAVQTRLEITERFETSAARGGSTHSMLRADAAGPPRRHTKGIALERHTRCINYVDALRAITRRSIRRSAAEQTGT